MILSKLLLILVSLMGAEVKVEAPDTAVVGEYILIDWTGSVGTVEFTVLDKEVGVWRHDNGTQVLLDPTKPGKLRYRLTAKDAAGIYARESMVDVTGDEVKPAPKPAPVPVPAPIKPVKPLPDSKVSIADLCRAEACKVQSPQRKADAALVIKQLEQLRDKVKSGQVNPSEINEMKAAVRSATRELPHDVLRRWNDWGAWWGKSIVTGISDGTLKTGENWVAFLDETILGLKAVT